MHPLLVHRHKAELYAFCTWIPTFLIASDAARAARDAGDAQPRLAWGFFVIADSAQFSVLVTESVPPHAVGTALMLQVSLGFLLTTITIQLIPPFVALIGWQGVFSMLAIGPVLGIASIRRLRRVH